MVDWSQVFNLCANENDPSVVALVAVSTKKLTSLVDDWDDEGVSGGSDCEHFFDTDENILVFFY